MNSRVPGLVKKALSYCNRECSRLASWFTWEDWTSIRPMRIPAQIPEEAHNEERTLTRLS